MMIIFYIISLIFKTDCWELFLNDICRQAVINRKILLNSDIFQVRDFIPVSMICDIIFDLLTNTKNIHGNTILNIGSGKTHTLIEIAKMVQFRCIQLFDYKPKIISRDGNAMINYPKFSFDVSELSRRIDTFPTEFDNEFDNEIDGLLRFCKKNYEIEN